MCSLLLTVMFHFLKTHFCFHTDEPPYWYWEVTVILKKMMLTGAMTIVAPGSSAQLVIALLIVMVNMLLILKLAPFLDDADDMLAFLTSVQMMLTLLGGLLLMTDNPTDPTYDPNFMGVTLVVINAFGFVALMFGLVALHPAVRRRINNFGAPKKKEPEKGDDGGSDTGSSTKIVPVKNTEEEAGATTIDVKEEDPAIEATVEASVESTAGSKDGTESKTTELLPPPPPGLPVEKSADQKTDGKTDGSDGTQDVQRRTAPPPPPGLPPIFNTTTETNPTEEQVTAVEEEAATAATEGANDAPAESVTSADVTEK